MNKLNDLHNQIYYVNNKSHTERLILSHNCNFKCTYCFQNRKIHKLLDMDILEKRIELLNLRLENVDEAIINLFGGEPTLNWNAFKRSVDEFKDRDKILLSTITNGSLLNEERIEYLSDAKNFHVDLSFDGNRDSNYKRIDFSRCDTFDLALSKLKLLMKYDIHFMIKATLGNFNYDSIFESLIMFKDLGVKSVYLQCIDNPIDLQISEQQMEKLIAFVDTINTKDFKVGLYNSKFSKKEEYKCKVSKIDTHKQWHITQPNGVTYSYIQGYRIGINDYNQHNVDYGYDFSNTNVIDVLNLNTLEYKKLRTID